MNTPLEWQFPSVELANMHAEKNPLIVQVNDVCSVFHEGRIHQMMFNPSGKWGFELTPFYTEEEK